MNTTYWIAAMFLAFTIQSCKMSKGKTTNAATPASALLADSILGEPCPAKTATDSPTRIDPAKKAKKKVLVEASDDGPTLTIDVENSNGTIIKTNQQCQNGTGRTTIIVNGQVIKNDTTKPHQ